MLSEVMVLVGNFGFPVVLSIYLLVRIEGKLENLAECIRMLSDSIKSN